MLSTELSVPAGADSDLPPGCAGLDRFAHVTLRTSTQRPHDGLADGKNLQIQHNQKE